MTALLERPAATLTLGGVALRAAADPPPFTARVLVAAVGLDRRQRRRYEPAATVHLAAMLVDEADRDALAGRLAERRRPVPLATLGEACAWLVEEATGRPFGHARVLSEWAVASWRSWRGLLMARGAPEPATFADLLDVAEALAAEDAMGMLRARQAVRKVIESGWRERETWGADGAAAMMAMLQGGKG